MKKTGQDLKVKIEIKKITQTAGNLKIKSLGTHTCTSEASLTNRIKEIDERISDTENK